MAPSCELSPSEQQQLRQWVADQGTPQQVALRCRIVLAATDGQSDFGHCPAVRGQPENGHVVA